MVLTAISRSVRLLFGPFQRCSPVIMAPRRQTVPARCVSQTATQPKPTVEENVAVNPTFVNRNPRNLERMALRVKDRGWATSFPQQEFYHRLKFFRSQHHITAEVFSYTSTVPVLSCSTKEWAVKRELVSTTSVAACQAVGAVLALRCQQAGLTRMVYKEIVWIFRSKSVQAFKSAMKEGGIFLSEPRRKYKES